jgi:alpha-1,6-mannosyltransferase
VGILQRMSVRAPLGATPPSGALELKRAALRVRAREAVATPEAGLAALGGLMICGLLISVAAASTDNLLPESVRPIPSWLAGPFGAAGIDIGVGGLMLVLTAMFCSYAVAVRAADRLSGRAVLTTIAALNALILLAPPLLSTDVFSYQIYGRMGALYGSNPYLHGPHAIALDPLYPFIGAKWVSTPSAYGPLFTGVSYLIAPLSIAASALAYKAIAALASLATVALIWNGARLRGLDPVRAAALFGLNPLVIVYGVGGGHNDLLMLALIVAGVVAALQYRDRTSGGLIVAAVAIKLTAGLVLPFAVARSVARKTRGRRFDLLAGAGIALAAIGAFTFGMFGAGPLRLPSTLASIQNEGDWHSIPGFISTRLGLGAVGHITGYLLAAGFITTLIVLLRRVARGRLDWIDGVGWATLVLLLTTSSLLPWYVAWLIPFAALASDRRLWKAAVVMTGVIQGIQLLGYLPHASALLGL